MKKIDFLGNTYYYTHTLVIVEGEGEAPDEAIDQIIEWDDDHAYSMTLDDGVWTSTCLDVPCDSMRWIDGAWIDDDR